MNISPPSQSVAKSVLLLQGAITFFLIFLFLLSYLGTFTSQSSITTLLAIDIMLIMLHMVYRMRRGELQNTIKKSGRGVHVHGIVSLLAIIFAWNIRTEHINLSQMVFLSGLWVASFASGIRVYREKYLGIREQENLLSK